MPAIDFTWLFIDLRLIWLYLYLGQISRVRDIRFYIWFLLPLGRDREEQYRLQWTTTILCDGMTRHFFLIQDILLLLHGQRCTLSKLSETGKGIEVHRTARREEWLLREWRPQELRYTNIGICWCRIGKQNLRSPFSYCILSPGGKVVR